MKVLVVGGGGREHALVWKLRQSPQVSQIYCAPGNAGIGEVAELVPVRAEDLPGLLRFARQNAVDLTAVGPELPLTLGIVDEFNRHSLRIFGPDKAAAQLEGSKAFTKDLLRRCKIPTGYFSTFTDPDEAKQYLAEVGPPIVVKADGLAAGKGVVICTAVREAEEAVDEIMRGRLFGDAGNRVVIEEFLEGEEASFMVLTDGTTTLPLATSQDHKAAYDGDKGPNTGGMGAYSPAPVITPAVHEHVMRDIIDPLLRGLHERKIKYKGVLYAGLMVSGGRAKVLEFNCRFGDPECQVILPRLRSDLVSLLEATIDERLAETVVEWDQRAAACVVLTAAGYPGTYEKGTEIRGLDRAAQAQAAGRVAVFHAGTAKRDSTFVTDGGRVLGVTALGDDVAAAVAEAYRTVDVIEWDGMHCRRDIGHRAMGDKQ
jgi:phosphoribosylamine---glycine ligase